MKVFGYAQIWTGTEIEIPENRMRDEEYIIHNLYEKFRKEGIEPSEIEFLDYNFG